MMATGNRLQATGRKYIYLTPVARNLTPDTVKELIEILNITEYAFNKGRRTGNVDFMGNGRGDCQRDPRPV
jgi:hypothetical protein